VNTVFMCGFHVVGFIGILIIHMGHCAHTHDY